MSTIAELQSQLDTLRSEVAQLREETQRFFRVQRDEDGTVTHTEVHCSTLFVGLINVLDPKSEIRAMLGVEETGPFVSLWGDDRRARLMARVVNNAGELEIYDDDLKPVVQLFADENRQGHVSVLSPGGIPRAIMKAMEAGGAVTAVAPDGTPRAVMHSHHGEGEMVVLTEGPKIKARMSAKPAGGTFDVRTADGKRGALLASAPTGNSLMLYKSDGNEAVSVVGGDAVSAITLGKLNEATAERPAAQLTNLPGFGGNLILRNAAGQDAVELSGGPGSGEIAVWGADPETRVKINTAGGGGTVIASRAGAPSAVHLTAGEQGGLVVVKAEDDSAALGASSKGGSLTIVKAGHPRAFMGVGDETHAGTILLTNADDTPAVNIIVTEHGGTMLLGGADGTTQIGCGASEEGGQISLFNELAVERATIRSKADGGGIHLKWGGTTGLIAAATERGGVVLTHNAEGNITDSLPNPPFPDGEEE